MNDAIQKMTDAVPERPLPVLAAMSAAKLQKQVYQAVLWIVTGFIPIGLTLLVGAPKIGKSWLALFVSLMIALNREVFGMRVTQCSVLYFALEDSPARLQRRMKIYGISEWPELLQFITRLPDDLDKDRLPDAIRDYVQNNPSIKLIFIDTMQFVRDSGQSDYGSDTEFLSVYQQLAHDLSIAIVMLHHTRKMAPSESDPFDLISGTQGLFGVADQVMLIRGNRGQADKSLLITGRDIEDQKLAFEFNAGIWTYIGGSEVAQLSPERLAVLKAIQASDEPIGPTAIAGKSGKGVNVVKNMLPKLIEAGFIQKVGTGKYAAAQDTSMPVSNSVVDVPAEALKTPQSPVAVSAPGKAPLKSASAGEFSF